MKFLKQLFSWLFSLLLWVGILFAAYVSIKYIYGPNPVAMPPTAFFTGWYISGRNYTGWTMLMDIGSGDQVTLYIPLKDSAGTAFITWYTETDPVWLAASGNYYTWWEVDTLLLWYVALTQTGDWNAAYDWVMVNSGDALYFRDNSWSYILRDSVDTGFNFPTSDILVPSEKAVVEYLSIYNPNQLMVGATGADCTWALVGTLIFSGDIFYWCTATTWRVALHE